MTKLCEQCRTLVATAFSGTMASRRRRVQRAAVLNMPDDQGMEYDFEPESDQAPPVESFQLESESALETEPNQEAGAALRETAFDLVPEESKSKEAELPEWEYSEGEWPVLLSRAKRNSFAQFKTAFVLVAGLAIAAAFYFFFPASQEHAKPAKEHATVIAEPAVSDTDSQDTKSSQASPAPAEPVNVDGKFALQAAAFPTQPEAEALSGKLKQAGVPSYVISADLARRGRWFRVRVGRFSTAEEAQKFTPEAQLRAKSAGLLMQLMVVPYEQP